MPIITNAEYNIGNIHLSNWIAKKNTQTKKNIKYNIKTQIFDYVIIGAGLTGTYLARRLSIQFPKAKILIIEKNNISGGRYCSIHQNEYIDNSLNIALEFGGMRIFSSIHPKMTNLVNELGLELTAVPYVSDNNLFYTRNHTFLNKNIFPDTNSVYFVDPSETNTNLFTTINDNISYIFSENSENTNNLYDNRKKVYSNINLSQLSFENVMMNGENRISTDNFSRFSDIVGYADIFNGNISFATAALENTSLNSFDSTQYFVKGGIQQIPQKCISNFFLVNISNVKTNNLKHTIITNTSLVNFSNNKNNIVDLIIKDNNNIKQNISTKNLFITCAFNELDSISGVPTSFVNSFTSVINQIPLLKTFLHFENNWWSKYNFTSGRCTTDMPISQLWFYNSNTLLIYSISKDADFWKNQLPYDSQTTLINTDVSSHSFIQYMMSFVSKMFIDYTNDIPLPDKIGWKYWENGTGFWKSTDKLVNKSIYNYSNNLIQNISPNKNIHYLNNDISLNQGWGEGCLEIVDAFLNL